VLGRMKAIDVAVSQAEYTGRLLAHSVAIVDTSVCPVPEGG
jgi:hypothetical protein